MIAIIFINPAIFLDFPIGVKKAWFFIPSFFLVNLTI